MNQMKRIILLSLIMTLTAFVSMAQTAVTGKVLDADTDEPLIGATVAVVGTSTGTATSLNGSFKLNVKPGTMQLKISYVGYESKEIEASVRDGEVIDLGTFVLESNALNLNEVKVVASVAVRRETPVALSTLEPKVILEKMGSQEFPEVLKSTPGVYATKQGGGFGDSRINLRGFDMRNIAVMINGVPVNDMESGWVYWSNWAGLSDVTRSMQVQRGLGASRVAVPSVGGTINILTKTTDSQQGGNLQYGIGNDGYNKVGLTASTGLNEKGWAASVSLAKTEGNGFVDATEFESYSYFASVSKRLNDAHTFTLSVFGAPQWHGQRRSYLTIGEVEEHPSGIRYNKDWGYKDGQVYHTNRNYYHKPQAILNHFWTIDRNTSLSTAVYASIGTGGGTGTSGDGNLDNYYNVDGQIAFDAIVEDNIAAGPNGSQLIRRTSHNNHNWYGALSTYTKDLGNLSLMGGIDARYYLGEHYRTVDDLLGGSFFVDDSNVNNPNNPAEEGDKISYYNDGEVLWGGLFAQAEYKLEALSTFISLSGSNKAYRRKDYFVYENSDPNQETDWVDFFGYMVKGGANYNLNQYHNVFMNTGFFERQPDFRSVFLNYQNLINDDARNEKVFSFELGYGYSSSIFSANLNSYYTQWLDKTFIRSEQVAPGEFVTANILGVDALHMGVEFDFVFQPLEKLDITGMASYGDWRWLNDIEGVNLFDDDQNLVDTYNLYISDVRIGDAAQQTYALGLDYELMDGLRIGADYNYYTDLYAQFDPLTRTSENVEGNPNSWELPDYGLVDLNVRYNFEISGMNASFFANMNNVFDTEYISDARDGSGHNWQSAEVFYGWGRSWTMSLRVNF